MTKKHFSFEEAEAVGNELGIKWTDFDVEQFRVGLDIELDHGIMDSETDVTGGDTIKTGKIVWAHLKKFPDYYTRLEAMEREAEDYWKDKKH